MKYVVFEEWSYVEPFYERCIIRKATKDDKEWDGWNFVSGAGRDGARINIYNGLEKAIIRSGYNPYHIQFDPDINKTQISKILSKYVWNQQIGLVKKEKQYDK